MSGEVDSFSALSALTAVAPAKFDGHCKHSFLKLQQKHLVYFFCGHGVIQMFLLSSRLRAILHTAKIFTFAVRAACFVFDVRSVAVSSWSAVRSTGNARRILSIWSDNAAGRGCWWRWTRTSTHN